jgi:hypothetical protein
MTGPVPSPWTGVPVRPNPGFSVGPTIDTIGPPRWLLAFITILCH